jgi:uncharacterized membrane protein
MEFIGNVIDGVGVLVIVIGATVSSLLFVFRLRGGKPAALFKDYRQSLGRSILLGLEFLIAGDIIRTVVVDPTLTGVGVLGMIVVIRIVLSLALEVELESRLPWQAKR